MMRAFFALIVKEVFERRLLFAAAALLGAMPLALPLLPGMTKHDPRDLITAAGGGLGLPFAIGISIALGSTLLNSDLFAGRTSFYFSRPIRGATLWAARVVVGLGIAAGTTLLLLLPTLLFGSPLESLDYLESTAGTFGLLLAGVTLLFVSSQFVTMLFRDRSPWLLLDVVAIAATGLVAWTCHERARAAWGGDIDSSAWWIRTAVACALFATISSAVQTIFGRSDLRYGRKLLSISLCICLALTTALEMRRARRFANPTIERVQLAAIHRSFPRGWLQLEVRLSGDPWSPNHWRTRGLIWHPADGRHRFLQPPREHRSDVVLSSEAETAAWLAVTADGVQVQALDLVRNDFADAEPTFSLAMNEPPDALALTPTGDRLAIATCERVDVYSTREAVRLSTHRMPRGCNYIVTMRFAASGALAIYRSETLPEEGGDSTAVGRTRLVLSRLHPDSAELTDVATSVGLRPYWFRYVEGEPARLESGRTVLDARTLEVLWDVPEEYTRTADGYCCVLSKAGRYVGALPDGRLLMEVSEQLAIYPAAAGPDLEGGPTSTLDLPGAAEWRLISAVGPHGVVLQSRDDDAPLADPWPIPLTNLWRLDLRNGARTRLADGIIMSSVRPTQEGELVIVATTDDHIVQIGPEGTGVRPLLEFADPTWEERVLRFGLRRLGLVDY